MRITRSKSLSEQPPGRSVVRGLVSPAGWDEDGRVVAVCIISDQGNPCFVLPGGAASEVMEHIRRYVSATGHVVMRHGVPHVRVESVVPTRDPEGAQELD
jgi:hypothetical protein